ETPPIEKHAAQEQAAPHPPDARAAPLVLTEEPPRATLAETLKPKPRPSIFEGGAGIGRAILFAVGVASAATGIGLAVAAGNKGNEAQQLAGAIQQVGGHYACDHSLPSLVTDCHHLLELRQGHDNYTKASAGFFAGAGVTVAAAAVSIWIQRTPATQ